MNKANKAYKASLEARVKSCYKWSNIFYNDYLKTGKEEYLVKVAKEKITIQQLNNEISKLERLSNLK